MRFHFEEEEIYDYVPEEESREEGLKSKDVHILFLLGWEFSGAF